MAHRSMSFRLPAFSVWQQRALHVSPVLQGPMETRRASACACGLSPLTAGILAENLRLLEDGRGIGVRLWNQWPRMFAGLRSLGEILVITCSECAVLGKYMVYPELVTDGGCGQAGDRDGEFDFEFASIQSANALHLRTPNGHNYGVEFLGAGGQTLHKVCLNAESAFDAFVEWVQVHQALGADPASPRQGSADDDTASPSIAPEEGIFVDPARLGAWLRACGQRGLPLQAHVGNGAVVQSHCFQLRGVQVKEPWLYCSGDEVGLHLDPAKVTRLVLHHVAGGGPACWALKAYGPSGQLSLALTPTAPGHLPAWHALTREVFPELPHC